ncbi:MAG: hypothetical protein IJN39_06430 [Clostridia bacterium]|nr:hypothetical protein [Clostridia bacterium]
MDGIIECLVKKEKTSSDTLKVFGLYVGAFVLTVLSFAFLKGFAIIGAAVSVYLAYYLSANFDLEFEYCMLGNDLRIEKIMSRKKRKQLIEINGIDVIAVVPQSNKDVLDMHAVQKTLFAAEKVNDDENYVIIAKSSEGTVKVVIKPDERIIEHYKTVMRSKVF